jgi:N-acylneuraminate cytidylyltransferase/CMP-N,N'-diacetyllegionaminic acid synthase
MEKTYKILAIIPARGGSKRIPKKNIVPLLGRPMIEYAFDAIKASRYVNRIVLSTDDEEIAEVGRKNGIEVPFLRPAELAQDHSPTEPVLTHALNFLREKENYWPDFVLLVQGASAPLIKTEQIDAALEMLMTNNVDSVETVIEVPTVFHPYNIRYIDEDGFTKFLFLKQRQEAKATGKRPKVYAIGNLFVFRPKNLFDVGTIQGQKSKSLIIDSESAVDVDTYADLRFAEFLMSKRKQDEKEG